MSRGSTFPLLPENQAVLGLLTGRHKSCESSGQGCYKLRRNVEEAFLSGIRFPTELCSNVHARWTSLVWHPCKWVTQVLMNLSSPTTPPLLLRDHKKKWKQCSVVKYICIWKTACCIPFLDIQWTHWYVKGPEKSCSKETYLTQCFSKINVTTGTFFF